MLRNVDFIRVSERTAQRGTELVCKLYKRQKTVFGQKEKGNTAI